jgi:hypothetical protein
MDVPTNLSATTTSQHRKHFQHFPTTWSHALFHEVCKNCLLSWGISLHKIEVMAVTGASTLCTLHSSTRISRALEHRASGRDSCVGEPIARVCLCVKLTIITSRTFVSPPITTQNSWGWSNCPQFCVVCDFRLASRIPVQSDPRQIRLDFCFFDVLTPPHESQSEELFGLQFSQCPASVAVLSACLNLTLPLPLPQRPLCLMSADLSHKLTMGSMIKN